MKLSLRKTLLILVYLSEVNNRGDQGFDKAEYPVQDYLDPPDHDQFKKNADLQKQFLNLASDLAQQPDSDSEIVEKVTTTKIPVAPDGELLLHHLGGIHDKSKLFPLLDSGAGGGHVVSVSDLSDPEMIRYGRNYDAEITKIRQTLPSHLLDSPTVKPDVEIPVTFKPLPAYKPKLLPQTTIYPTWLDLPRLPNFDRITEDRNSKSDSKSEPNITKIDVTKFVTLNSVSTVHVSRGEKRYRKKLNFDDIDRNILNLMQIIDDLDPDILENNYELLNGRTKTFHMQKTLTHHGLAKIECELIDSTLIDLATFDDERLIAPRPVILRDKLVIYNGIVHCLNFTQTTSIDSPCVRPIFTAAANLKLNMIPSFKSSNWLLQHLKKFNDTSMYILINGTHLILDQEAQGYAVCSTLNAVPLADFRSIVQDKYFGHLSSVLRNLVNSFAKKSVKFKKLFF